MYVVDLAVFTGFEWDTGNLDKSYRKHGITPIEAEEVFLDSNIQVKRDLKHQESEERYIAIGQIARENILFIVFTLRADMIRVISARRVNKKERRLYEEKIKTNTKI